MNAIFKSQTHPFYYEVNISEYPNGNFDKTTKEGEFEYDINDSVCNARYKCFSWIEKEIFKKEQVEDEKDKDFFIKINFCVGSDKYLILDGKVNYNMPYNIENNSSNEKTIIDNRIFESRYYSDYGLNKPPLEFLFDENNERVSAIRIDIFGLKLSTK